MYAWRPTFLEGFRAGELDLPRSTTSLVQPFKMLAMDIAIIQQIGGILLILLILLDVFLTVLYARMGTGLVSRRVGRLVWRCFRVISQGRRENRDRILSCCGPVILVVLVFTWVGGLALGNALLIHPMLGRSIQSSSGKTPTDFVSALYAGGSSISIVGSSDFTPRTSGSRLRRAVRLGATRSEE